MTLVYVLTKGCNNLDPPLTSSSAQRLAEGGRFVTAATAASAVVAHSTLSQIFLDFKVFE